MGLFIPAAAQQLFSVYRTFDPSSETSESARNADPGFLCCLTEHMGGALQRLESLLMGQEEINSFLNTHRLLQVAHPSLVTLAYSTCGSNYNASLSLPFPHVNISKYRPHSASFSLLNAAALASVDNPEQTDLSAAIAKAAIDLDIPLISTSYYSTLCPDSGTVLGPTVTGDVLGATLREQTVLTALLCPGSGSILLERYPSLLVRAVLGEGGGVFNKHGAGLAVCAVQLEEKVKGRESDAAESHVVVMKLISLVIAAVLADRGSGNTIPPAVAAHAVSCFLPLFAPIEETLSLSSSSALLKSTAGGGTEEGGGGGGESLLLLLELNALLPLHRNLSLHSLTLSHCMKCLRGAQHTPLEDLYLALKSLPFVLSGYAAGSPRSFSNFKEDEKVASEVYLIKHSYLLSFLFRASLSFLLLSDILHHLSIPTSQHLHATLHLPCHSLFQSSTLQAIEALEELTASRFPVVSTQLDPSSTEGESAGMASRTWTLDSRYRDYQQ